MGKLRSILAREDPRFSDITAQKPGARMCARACVEVNEASEGSDDSDRPFENSRDAAGSI